MLYHVVIAGLFAWNSIQDIKHKSLGNRGLLAGCGLVLLLLITDGVYDGVAAQFLLSEGGVPWRKVWGVLPGVGLLVLSRVMNGSIGKGDGYLLCISGLALGLRMNLSLLFYALFFAGGVSAILLVLKKVKKDTTFPFVPFLLGGYLMTLLQYKV